MRYTVTTYEGGSEGYRSFTVDDTRSLIELLSSASSLKFITLHEVSRCWVQPTAEIEGHFQELERRAPVGLPFHAILSIRPAP